MYLQYTESMCVSGKQRREKTLCALGYCRMTGGEQLRRSCGALESETMRKREDRQFIMYTGRCYRLVSECLKWQICSLEM